MGQHIGCRLAQHVYRLAYGLQIAIGAQAGKLCRSIPLWINPEGFVVVPEKGVFFHVRPSISDPPQASAFLNSLLVLLDSAAGNLGAAIVHDDNLIWIDLEMTGLDTDTDSILEIACVVTDRELKVLAEGPVFAIAHPLEQLQGMDSWNRNQHCKSGLWDRVLAATTDHATAEQNTLDFLQSWVPTGKSPMCGNSICQDRRFMYRQMPALERYFHYRHIDVSTIKELARRWMPEVLHGCNKVSAHTALSDIHDSIAELRYYREHLFRPSTTVVHSPTNK